MSLFIAKSLFVIATLSLCGADNCGESRSDYYRNYQDRQESQRPGCNCSKMPSDQEEFMEKLGPLHKAIYSKAFDNDLRQEAVALYQMSDSRMTPNQAVERVIESYRDESNNRQNSSYRRKNRDDNGRKSQNQQRKQYYY